MVGAGEWGMGEPVDGHFLVWGRETATGNVITASVWSSHLQHKFTHTDRTNNSL